MTRARALAEVVSVGVAVLVGRKTPERAIRDASAQVDHLLRAIRP